MLDVAIIGGGVAGSSLAYCLARRGLVTALWDKARFPRPKACGEGLLPRGVAALRVMGLEPPPFPRISGFRIVAKNGAAVEGAFPGEHGLAVQRERFDAWLLERARDAGATIHEGETMPDGIAARFIVAADGLHSRFFAARPDRPARIGFSARATGLDVGDKVEIRFREEGEVYLAPGEGDTHVAVLLRAKTLRGQPGERVIARLLDGDRYELTTPILGMGPLGRRVRDPTRGHVLAIGDAAGAPDPITGEGMSLALRSALVAAEALARGVPAEYAAWRRREGDAARRIGRRLLLISRASDRVVRNLKRDPELVRLVMRTIVGEDEAGLSLGLLFRMLVP